MDTNKIKSDLDLLYELFNDLRKADLKTRTDLDYFKVQLIACKDDRVAADLRKQIALLEQVSQNNDVLKRVVLKHLKDKEKGLDA